MTDNEKLECAMHCMKVQAEVEICGDCKAYNMDNSACRDIAREAIKALEEVQEYRKLGTVEDFRKMAYIMNKSDTDELWKIIDDWIKYQKLGTVEEIKNIQSKTINDLINTIQKEIDSSCSSIYECEDGTEITTDVGYVYDWFQEYKEVIKKKYGMELYVDKYDLIIPPEFKFCKKCEEIVKNNGYQICDGCRKRLHEYEKEYHCIVDIGVNGNTGSNGE